LDDQQGWACVVVPGDVALSVSLAVHEQSVLAVAYTDQLSTDGFRRQRDVVA
jgi:hypothetical protein